MLTDLCDGIQPMLLALCLSVSAIATVSWRCAVARLPSARFTFRSLDLHCNPTTYHEAKQQRRQGNASWRAPSTHDCGAASVSHVRLSHTASVTNTSSRLAWTPAYSRRLCFSSAAFLLLCPLAAHVRVVTAQPQADAAQSMYHGNQERNGQSNFTADPLQSLRWRYQTMSWVTSSFTIDAYNRVFAWSEDGNLYALDGASGTMEFAH